MKNNKGFTLTEVLLAAMIVGIIGIALAALTTAALRESSTGRSRMMLRNQISLFLRQLRQDVQRASGVEKSGNSLVLKSGDTNIVYACSCSEEGGRSCRRTVSGSGTSSETVLNHVQCVNVASQWNIASAFTIDEEDSSAFTVRLVVGVDGEPPVREAIQEIFVLP